mgnify:FL=1
MMSQEEKILDHEYDGIQELDNPLPRWWVYLFYMTVVFGLGYFVYFTFGYGPSLSDKHAAAVQSLNQKQSEPAADGSVSLSFQASPERLEEGKRIYISKCAACHKPDGGGAIGPSLTDAYWLHGTGSNEDIYEVIRKGVPEKGMMAWESTLSPAEIESVVLYIQSIKGSAKNGKPPEGTLYQ